MIQLDNIVRIIVNVEMSQWNYRFGGLIERPETPSDDLVHWGKALIKLNNRNFNE